MTRHTFDNQKPTVMMLGRFQPWHDGHLALFQRALAKTGQVCIMVRDVQGVDDNPFAFQEIKDRIIKELAQHGYFHAEDYIIQLVPNITNITYGRAVGYTIEQETFDEATHAISATDIRAQMRKDGSL